MARLRATIVVDTSAILNNLYLVQSLCNEAPANEVEILLPRETLKELDRIKDREKFDSHLGRKAREAINWISGVLIAQDPDSEYQALRGQKAAEVLEKNLKNDDSILDCALYNRSTTQRLTILLSDDRNLSNRAVIDGLETLDAARDVTAARVYEAIAQRTMNEMEFDDVPDSTMPNLGSSQWSVPQSSVPASGTPQPSTPRWSTPQWSTAPVMEDEEMQDEEMVLDPEPHVPAEEPRKPHIAGHAPVHASMPGPVQGGDMQETVLQSLSTLMDWYIRQAYEADELDLLKYRPPSTSADVARALKQFNTVFWGVVPRETIEKFVDAVKAKTVNRNFIVSHVKLLLALAGDDPTYEKMLAAYF